MGRASRVPPFGFEKAVKFCFGVSIVPSSHLFPKSLMCHARSVWWLETKLYAPRKPRHRLASLGNPKKKKCSLLFLIFAGVIFSKMERTFFFLGFCPPSIRAVRGASIRTKFWQNYFLGRKGFAKTSADLFLNLDVANGKGGVWEGIFHLLRFFLLAKFGRAILTDKFIA